MDRSPTGKLLRVEASVFVETRGLIVAPGVPVPRLPDGKSRRPVVLQRPDGTTIPAHAEFQFGHVTPAPKEPFFFCTLIGVTKEDVPNGTEVWLAPETKADQVES
jgi:hypothetical protein